MLLPLLSVLGFLALHHERAEVAAQLSNDDAYFYGESPPVYPPANITGIGSWAAAYAKAKAMVNQMTLEEKVNLTAGYSRSNGCSGNIAPNTRLGFPGLCLSDAGNGVRGADLVNSYASGISVGASWNRDLAHARGLYMGGEFATKGVNVALGPVVGPLGRLALGGRNWEGFSNDPYLCGALAYQAVSGMQKGGTVTSVKHYIGNEQETDRNPSGNVAAVSANIDDRTMHELYLWPFQDVVYAGTGNIMCSYNRVNNSYACQNSKTLNGYLKEELGFQGFVVTDWGAQHGGVASAMAGLDMAMPSSTYWGDNLTEAVNNGSVPEYRVTDMATRIIATWYQAGQDKNFPEPGIGMPESLSVAHKQVNARKPAAASTIYQGAVEGHVLVKNENNALPLKNPTLLSLFGYAATDETTQGPTPGSSGFSGFSSTEIAQENYTLFTGGGSGANSPAYVSDPFGAITDKCIEKGCSMYWDFKNADPVADPDSDACLVFVNAYATEGQDRPNLHDDYSDGIIKSVASTCSNTIVIFQNAGIRLVDTFVDNANITAIVYEHLPGQDTGRALAALLWGEENFSGKLPYTVAKNESDYDGLYSPTEGEGFFKYYPQSNFTEGLYIDYRMFDENGTEPRYEFGYGLSYTTFGYSGLSVSKCGSSYSTYPTGKVVVGGQADLWNNLIKVTATVKNTGSVNGAEAAQLYVGIPNAPTKQLRGFSKPTLTAGQSTTVEFDLTRRDLSIWDVTAQKWKLQKGTYKVYVGSSSRTLPLTGSFTL